MAKEKMYFLLATDLLLALQSIPSRGRTSATSARVHRYFITGEQRTQQNKREEISSFAILPLPICSNGRPCSPPLDFTRTPLGDLHPDLASRRRSTSPRQDLASLLLALSTSDSPPPSPRRASRADPLPLSTHPLSHLPHSLSSRHAMALASVAQELCPSLPNPTKNRPISPSLHCLSLPHSLPSTSDRIPSSPVSGSGSNPIRPPPTTSSASAAASHSAKASDRIVHPARLSASCTSFRSGSRSHLLPLLHQLTRLTR